MTRQGSLGRYDETHPCQKPKTPGACPAFATQRGPTWATSPNQRPNQKPPNALGTVA